MLKLNNLNKSFINNLGMTKNIFTDLNFHMKKGDFVSVIGSNGAGKSTLFNLIMGNTELDQGEVIISNKNITNFPKHKRNSFMSKVYQNPSFGTSPSMTVFENLSMADNKGEVFGLTFGLNKKRKNFYKETLAELDLGIEEQLDTKVGSLSGGQRQCLALIMATLKKPKLLLLDEHTAALDPKTSKIIMNKTSDIVKKEKIATIMITHNLQDAIDYGNRLIMLHEGNIILDIEEEEKKSLSVEKLLKIFNEKHLKLKDNEVFIV
ncbi:MULTISPECIES: ABC transporter ATP-binding protein [Psychrilyobacter]|uniref:ATP-binding cassette domain-containing protein n=1 Tax=Psychrilyobacter piezotolerans TaxID=2293438 RepID=A0ABX9KH75_9FUSO|nr:MULTISPECIES: ATP-binding cassette domain-containing protein [Psychrilyobacter]MCS5420694.1 ATP-binding cassette domain-containing protein [Psychrilyobacter sp. S5]NDI77868.1 ATP-binding cassette domain-containing protein [Psychrilyobacter piezotolerans]RDE62278.1 ATP-binding cassette domain-containing protein [Psychrilyobacter sp. S5]REI41376.1 ATP-binding cassette domain-containing protein [Psychrilyobacter piezotolerans]